MTTLQTKNDQLAVTPFPPPEQAVTVRGGMGHVSFQKGLVALTVVHPGGEYKAGDIIYVDAGESKAVRPTHEIEAGKPFILISASKVQLVFPGR